MGRVAVSEAMLVVIPDDEPRGPACLADPNVAKQCSDSDQAPTWLVTPSPGLDAGSSNPTGAWR
jgi:hypothetical protein